ncbi:MAG: FAA hydrolase family protein [Saprospirales bacterium]|nr:MAG: FAA hydrolase family protein [Saprospirales bacterium]
MKIFCIGRNYVDHARELGNEVPDEPVVFMKPPGSLLVNGKPFYYPDFSSDIHYESELVIKICKNGRHIDPAFASRYYDKVALGIDLTARDLQKELKKKGLPWELAKAFHHSAPISKFIPISSLEEGPINFHLEKNGEVVQRGNTEQMIHSFENLIVFLSRYFTLQMNDLIFTGTPAGVGPIAVGDHFRGYLNGKPMLNCQVR